MNVYVNINGKTRYFKSREEADAAMGKNPAEDKKPAEGKKPAESKKPAEGKNNDQQDNE